MKQLLFLILVFGFMVSSWAQEPAIQQTLENLLESAGESMSDDTDIQEILDDLEYFRQNPIHVNTGTKEEFLRLHLLSETQTDQLLVFREKNGAILSIYEMAAIEGFSPDMLMKLEPFLSFGTPGNWVSKKRASNDLFVRSSRSFSSLTQSDNFEGSPERHYVRFKHISEKIEIGAIAEKDPGEAFFASSNKHGFDYLNAGLNFRIGKDNTRLFVGAYQVHFGQGLVAWQGFSMGKSAEVTQVFKSNQGIRSYSSTDENQFFRGIATKYKSGRFTFYPFISRSRIDAHVDTLDEMASFGAFQTSGYHRTTSENAGENALRQTVGGGHLTADWKNWSFGLTSIYTHFDVAMNRSDDPYNQFLPEGKGNLVSGFDWKGTIKNVLLFGEAAFGQNSGRAFLSGLLLKPVSNAELSLVYRNINKSYFSYFSNAFIESSRTNDEHGLYVGLKLFPAPKWILNAYADLFQFNWIKYTTSAPSEGTEVLVQASYNPSGNTNFYLRFFQEEKGQRLITETNRYNEQQMIRRLRLNYTQVVNEWLSLKSRIEFSSYSKLIQEKGFLLLQDFSFKPAMRSYSLNFRLAYFDTDGYNSRLYAYENDVLYAFSIPALYDRGIRTYLNFRQKVGTNFTFWLKLASTHVFAEIQVDESTKYEFKVQLRYQF